MLSKNWAGMDYIDTKKRDYPSRMRTVFDSCCLARWRRRPDALWATIEYGFEVVVHKETTLQEATAIDEMVNRWEIDSKDCFVDRAAPFV